MSRQTRDAASTDTQSQSDPIPSGLTAISNRVDITDCDDFYELGLYSVHQSTARMITIPKAASGFHEAPAVKQYYYDADDRPLLIIAPVDPV